MGVIHLCKSIVYSYRTRCYTEGAQSMSTNLHKVGGDNMKIKDVLQLMLQFGMFVVALITLLVTLLR